LAGFFIPYKGLPNVTGNFYGKLFIIKRLQLTVPFGRFPLQFSTWHMIGVARTGALDQ
jgi:hypothetical protein